MTHRVHELGTETAFEVLARAKRLEAEGREILHLEIGEPDFPTPPHIVEAGIRALSGGATKYAPAAGLFELREMIAQWVQRRGLAAGPDNVIVTSGAKPMLFYALLALIEPGDEVLIPDPAFPIYESVVRFASGRPVHYSVDPARPRPVDVAEIRDRISSKTSVLVLNSPHNPTGVVLDPHTLGALAEIVAQHDLAVLSDEIYSQLVFDGEHTSIASRPGMAERTVVIDGFSKAYAMAGWRLGYGVLPAIMARQVERFVINTTSCAPPFVQHAGLAALVGSQQCVRDMCKEYHARGDLLTSSLNAIDGVSCAPPQGAFYAFPKISRLTGLADTATKQFSDTLLHVLNLTCLPGTAFGPSGKGHLRFSFATSRTVLQRAVEAFRAAMATTPTHPRSLAGREFRLSVG